MRRIPDATVHVVADAVSVLVGFACPPHTEGVQPVAVAVAVPVGDASTPAVVDVARPIADPQASNSPTQLSTSSQTPSSSTSAEQVPPHTPRASSWLPMQSQSLRDVGTAASDVARPIAHAACVEFTDATVHVVAHIVAVHICGASSSAHTKGVKLVAVAIAVPVGDVIASAFVDVTGPIAHAACVELPTQLSTRRRRHRRPHLQSKSSAHAEGVQLAAAAVAVPVGDVIASALVDLARPIAHAACVECPDATVDVV